MHSHIPGVRMRAMRPDTDNRALLTLLAWYQEMGVDAAVSDAAVNWLDRGDVPPGQGFRLSADGAVREIDQSLAPTLPRAPTGTPAPTPRQTRTAPPRDSIGAFPARAPSTPTARPFAGAPAEAAERAARQAAREATDLDALEATLRQFDGCGLKATAKNLCFYRGAKQSRLMIIGEAPGRDEDLAGLPFVGRAGQLLDKMLAAISLKEADVHITNVVYWRPPGNRTPTPQESEVCRPFLERQMELVAPDVVLLLGGAAAKQVLGVTDGIMRLRGRWREIENGARAIPTMATLHPAYLLRTPAAKRQAWRDLQAVRAALDERKPKS